MKVKFNGVGKLLIGEDDDIFRGPDNIDSMITQTKKVPRQGEIDMEDAIQMIADLI